jgi:acetolactate decarboxylase
VRETDDATTSLVTLGAWARQAATVSVRPSVLATVTVADLGRHGTLGLGALAGSGDGLVLVDRRCFRMRPDGTAAAADPAGEIGFAVVSTFSPDIVVAVEPVEPAAAVASVADLEARIAAVLPPRDFGVAVSAHGVFDRVRTRARGTGTTLHRTLAGRLVGFRTPGPGGAGAGLHLAVLDATRTRAGALVDFAGFSGRIELGFSTALHLAVPDLGVVFDGAPG